MAPERATARLITSTAATVITAGIAEPGKRRLRRNQTERHTDQ